MLAAWGCGKDAQEAPPDLPAIGNQVSLLRFPREGGAVEAYDPDSLGHASWTTSKPVPPIRKVLGANLDERLAWAVDSKNNLIVIDLESRGVREQLKGVTFAAMGPDGSLYLADAERRVVHFVRRNPVTFQDPLPAAPQAFFGSQNDQLVAVTGGKTPQLISANAEQGLNAVDIPAGNASATFWGDLVALAADTAVILYETSGRRSVTSIRARRAPGRWCSARAAIVSTWSRVTTKCWCTIAFRSRSSGASAFPAFHNRIRLDASGRWMLARPAEADSVWVVDLATNRPPGRSRETGRTTCRSSRGPPRSWCRRGDDVATYDLRQAPPALQRVMDGAGRRPLGRRGLGAPGAAARRGRRGGVGDGGAGQRAGRGFHRPPRPTPPGSILQVSTVPESGLGGAAGRQLKAPDSPPRCSSRSRPDEAIASSSAPIPPGIWPRRVGRKLGPVLLHHPASAQAPLTRRTRTAYFVRSKRPTRRPPSSPWPDE